MPVARALIRYVHQPERYPEMKHINNRTGFRRTRSTCLPDRESAIVALTCDYIARTLSVYREEWHGVKSAIWHPRRWTLETIIQPHEYPFTKPGSIRYVTAAMMMLYLSQASYLIARCAIEDNGWALPAGLTAEHFFRCRDRGALVIADVQCRFRTPTSLPGTFSIEHSIVNFFTSKSSLAACVAFRGKGRSFTGKLTVAMPSPT